MNREEIKIQKLRKLSLDERVQIYKKAMELREMYGWGSWKIAKILNLSPKTVGSWIYENKKPDTKPKRSRKVSERMIREWAQQYENGLSTCRIAENYEVSNQTVWKYLHGLGVKMRKKEVPKMSKKKIEKLLKCVKKEGLNFLQYFYWKPTINSRDLLYFKRFIDSIKFYRQGLRISEISRKLRMDEETIRVWICRLSIPKLAHLLEDYSELGKPKNGCQWLSLNIQGTTIPIGPYIQVPSKVRYWAQVKFVIDQLEPLKEAYMKGKKFGLDPMDIQKMKYCLFAYLLGSLIGDCSKSKPRTPNENMSIKLELSRGHKSNIRFGDFVEFCANAVGIRMHRIKDAEPMPSRPNGSYQWNSQNSAFITWIFQTLIGLRINETTTNNSVRMTWILTTPRFFKIYFIQGIADSDASKVDITDQRMRIETYPNTNLLQKILRNLGVPTTRSMKDKSKKRERLSICHGLKKAFQLPIFSPYVKSYRYQLMERLIKAQRMPKGKWPKWLHDEVYGYIRRGLTTREIVSRILDRYEIIIRRSSISYARNKLFS